MRCHSAPVCQSIAAVVVEEELGVGSVLNRVDTGHVEPDYGL
jgi:hypothetical protein